MAELESTEEAFGAKRATVLITWYFRADRQPGRQRIASWCGLPLKAGTATGDPLIQQSRNPATVGYIHIIFKKHCELLPYPPYSPDLAVSDYFLFSDLAQNARMQECRNSKTMMK